MAHGRITNMALILGIESTCDETAAAVVADGVSVRSSVIASQVDLHAKFRGVVPEIASRAHIENILPVMQEALSTAGVTLDQIDAVAVTHRPGLIGSLLIGVTAAKTLAWAIQKPLIGVDHVQAHLYSVVLGERDEATKRRSDEEGAGGTEARDTEGTKARRHEGTKWGRGEEGVSGEQLDPQSKIENRKSKIDPNPQSAIRNSQSPPFPAVGLVCSGGHTALYALFSWTDVKLIGSTIDDAVGEAYDKVAAILGLGYPGGPIIDRLAALGNPEAIKFPRTLLKRDSLDFSFSGIKTAVLYHVRGYQGRQRDPASLSQQEVHDVAAGFQAACIDVLLTKLRRALRRTGGQSVIIGGGVSANRGLRAALSQLPVPAFVPAPQYCTDNAAMAGGLGDLLLSQHRTSGLDLDAITYSAFRV